jgi:hypothetical protein
MSSSACSLDNNHFSYNLRLLSRTAQTKTHSIQNAKRFSSENLCLKFAFQSIFEKLLNISRNEKKCRIIKKHAHKRVEFFPSLEPFAVAAVEIQTISIV